MSENQDDLLAQFQGITSAEIERARFFLESADWNLEAALSSFFEATEDISEPVEVPQAAAQADPPREPPKPSPAPRPTTGNIRTIESDSEDSDSDMEEGQAFYAGGSETSGQQILGPPKKKDGRDFVKEMFKKAREHGAEAVDPSSLGASSSSGRPAFVGTGFRLGSTDISSHPIEQSTSKAARPQPREFTLKMWRNGFSIDDGELRSYEDPQNRDFLMSVMAGRIPKELVSEAKGGEVHVNMEDHKEEEYKKPKASVKPFQGAGHMLGSVVPPVVTSAPTAAEQAGFPQLEAEAQQQIGFRPEAPATTIQVRLPDGRLQAKLNHTNTVGDLRLYIRTARPHLNNFTLLTTFPNKELEDDSQSLQDAGLLGAAILLRPK